MTYNIHHGEGVDGRVDVQRLADVIVGEAADVVFLQEVDRGVPRSGYRDLGWELARDAHMHVVFGKNVDVSGGDYGTAILSTRPLSSQRHVHLPMPHPGEQRGLLFAEIVVEGRLMRLINVHADNRADDEQRVFHMSRVIELADNFGVGPIILAGDLNDTPDSRVCAQIGRSFEDVWALTGVGVGQTFPTRNPSKRVDFIWVREADVLIPQRAWIPWADASDHLPVVAEFAVVPVADDDRGERP